MKWLKQWRAGKVSTTPKHHQSKQDEVIDLTDPDVIAGFKPWSNVTKESKPVCPLKNGGLLLLAAEDIKSVFKSSLWSNEPSRYSALAPKNKTKYVAASVAANIPPFLDSAHHTEVRRWLSKAFFERTKSFDHQIKVISQTHIKNAKDNYQYLLVEDLARNFVTDTMAQFVGIHDSHEDIKAYTSALFRLFAPAKNTTVFEETNEALQHARQGLLAALLQRRKDKTPCLLTSMDNLPFDFDTEHNKDFMIADNALLILADGIENVEASIGQVMMQWSTLAQQSDSITEDFVRQCIHADTPGQTIPRIASQEMLINGHIVKAGTPIFLSLASANNELEASHGLSFGKGRHRCIGERLAISMITIFCNEIIKNKPLLDYSKLTYAPMFGHKWLRNVSISLTKRST